MAQSDFDALISWPIGETGWGEEMKAVMADLKPVPPAVAALDERIDDRVANLLVAGTNVTLAYDDTAGTITISASGGTGGGLTQEQAEDIVAALIDDNSDLGWTYVDNADAAGSLVAVIKAGAVTDAMLAGSIAISKVSGLQAALDTKAARVFTKRVVTGTYTLVAADATDVVLHCTATSALTITLPQDSAAVIAQEVAIPWRQYGAGQVTFVAGSGAALLARGSAFKAAGQHAEGVVTKVAANTWLLSGDISA